MLDEHGRPIPKAHVLTLVESVVRGERKADDSAIPESVREFITATYAVFMGREGWNTLGIETHPLLELTEEMRVREIEMTPVLKVYVQAFFGKKDPFGQVTDTGLKRFEKVFRDMPLNDFLTRERAQGIRGLSTGQLKTAQHFIEEHIALMGIDKGSLRTVGEAMWRIASLLDEVTPQEVADTRKKPRRTKSPVPARLAREKAEAKDRRRTENLKRRVQGRRY